MNSVETVAPPTVAQTVLQGVLTVVVGGGGAPFVQLSYSAADSNIGAMLSDLKSKRNKQGIDH